MIEISIRGKGKRRQSSKATALRRIKDGREYFIRRGGAWYRENAAGYTQDLLEAGVYSASVARSHLSAEGVTVVPLDSMRDEIWKKMQATLERAAKLSALALR